VPWKAVITVSSSTRCHASTKRLYLRYKLGWRPLTEKRSDVTLINLVVFAAAWQVGQLLVACWKTQPGMCAGAARPHTVSQWDSTHTL
jgi:hypothetical protein